MLHTNKKEHANKHRLRGRFSFSLNGCDVWGKKTVFNDAKLSQSMFSIDKFATKIAEYGL